MQGRLTSPPQQEKQVKQSKLTHFFTSKSPKAEEIRGRKDKEIEIPTKKERETRNQESKHKPGGPSAPFREIREDYECLPTADALDPTTTSEARAGCAEVRGRPARKQGKKQNRAEWVLGKMDSGKKDRKWKLAKETLQETQGSGNPAGRVRGLRHYFEVKGKDIGPSLEQGRSDGKDPDSDMGQDRKEAPGGTKKGKNHPEGSEKFGLPSSSGSPGD